ncbi:uncharacterized protein LOC111043372 [Nilaparvata lugens]|uniref:uncharacterized protein LOC111043372 n=1 Tax=Nilaparvata lugens TaxID=108931 RepID=UPI00193D8A03|nr:uncharacterized protein LOC111043372 [Nilaparvata lugens]
MFRALNYGLATLLLIFAYILDAVSGSEVIKNGFEKFKSIPIQSCTIPESEEHYYTSFDGSKRLHPKKDIVEGNGQHAVKVKCRDSSKQSKAADLAVCFDGKWYPSDHECVSRTCHPVQNTTSTNYTCTSPEGSHISCDQYVPSNTQITIQCSHWRYANPNGNQNKKLCLNGIWEKWDTCEYQCGVTVEPPPEVNLLKKALYKNPWHVLIYHFKDNKWSHKCMGTIISTNKIVTAHICFPSDTDLLFDIRVVVGQYRDFRAPESSSRMLDVEKVSYSRADEYSSIAIITTKTNIHYDDTVGDACFSLDPNFDISQASLNWKMAILKVDTVSRIASKESVRMSLISNSQCLPRDKQFKENHLRPDQFCAVFVGNGRFNATDIGTGLMFAVKLPGNSLQYYLQGILDGAIDDSRILTFINMFRFETQFFIYSIIHDNKSMIFFS